MRLQIVLLGVVAAVLVASSVAENEIGDAKDLNVDRKLAGWRKKLPKRHGGYHGGYGGHHGGYGGYGGYGGGHHTADASATAHAYGPNTHTSTNTKAVTTPYSSHSSSHSSAVTNGRKLNEWQPGYYGYGYYGGYHTADAKANADAYGYNTHTDTKTKAVTTPYSSHSNSKSSASTYGRKLAGWWPRYGGSRANAKAMAHAYGPNSHTYTDTKAVTTPHSAYASAQSRAVSGRKQ